MQTVIRADGTLFRPPEHTGRGRKGKWPWRYLEVGDSFVAPIGYEQSFRTAFATARMFGQEHEIKSELGAIRCLITRIK